MGDGIERLSRVVDGGGESEGTEEQAGEKRRRRIGRDCFFDSYKGRGQPHSEHRLTLIVETNTNSRLQPLTLLFPFLFFRFFSFFFQFLFSNAHQSSRPLSLTGTLACPSSAISVDCPEAFDALPSHIGISSHTFSPLQQQLSSAGHRIYFSTHPLLGESPFKRLDQLPGTSTAVRPSSFF